MQRFIFTIVAVLVLGIYPSSPAQATDPQPQIAKEFTVYPIGYVRKVDGRTTIVLDKKYQPALLGVDKLENILVFWWFDRNDTSEKRSILQVHPGGNPKNPIRGVFATHSPVRPNLIAITRCKVLSVKENVIEIESIDAFADTAVLDIKN